MQSKASSNRFALSQNDSLKTHSTNDKKPLQAVVYGNFENLDSTDYMLIPLGLKTISENSQREVISKSLYDDGGSSSYSDSKYNFRKLNMQNCNNIIFYNKKTEETNLLLNKPAIISNFYFPYYNSDYIGSKFYFDLVGIVDNDFNGDGFLNSADDEKVFMYDISGKNAVQLTPDNTQLLDWFIDVSTNNILMYVRTDSDGDKKFDGKDEIRILKSAITKPAMGKEIINPEIKKSIQSILEQIR